MMLHWLCPVKQLSDGLMALVAENSVKFMLSYVTDGGLVDIYVEDIIGNEPEQQSYWDGEVPAGGEETSKQSYWEDVPAGGEENSNQSDGVQGYGTDSSPDSDFVLSDCSTSDDEVEDIRQKYKEFKSKSKSKGKGSAATDKEKATESQSKKKVVAYSSDEDDEDSDGQLVVHESEFLKFSSEAEVKKFTLGMKFSGKKEFKDAIVDYGLKKRKEIKFIKDEGDRVRAKCTWPSCKWVCLARKTGKFESWQITSFIDEHTCPKRRDNKLVTTTRIADKFENLIKSNTDWSVQNLKAIVQEEMFANVHIPGEITMPGRKEKQRTREQQEKPRCATRVSKRGTKIRCSLCKLLGHNKTSCKARNGIGSSSTAAGPNQASAPTQPPVQGQGPARSKAPSAAFKRPSASQAPSSSQAPSASQAAASQGLDMPSRQSSTRQSKRKATEEMTAPNAKRRAPTNSSSRSNKFPGNTINVQGSSNVNVNVSTSTSSARASSRVVKGSGSASARGRGRGKRKYAGYRSLLGFDR